MASSPTATFIIVSTAVPIVTPLSTTSPTLASATYVAVEPTSTHIKNMPTYSPAAAYLSMRIMTVGGLTLLLIGLCCLAAVLLRFSRYERRSVHVVDNEKALVLDQSTINKTFPIRIYPSSQRLFLDEDEMVIASVAAPAAPLPDTVRTTMTDSIEPISTTEEKHQHHHHKNPDTHPPSFMGLRLWSRDSSRSSSQCSSPRPIHLHQMPSFTASMNDLQRPLSTSTSSSPAILQPMDTFVTISQPETDEKHDGGDDKNQDEANTECIPETAGVVLEETNSAPSEELCSICLGEYEANDRLRILSCGHEYHAECIGEFYLTSG
ncbi:hypothetical protein BG004_003706 [Podila humilis]|nr:hypothetical protein BG004_003706 [Podila humilis]